MQGMTLHQARVYDYLRARDVTPSYREIQRDCDVGSLSAVHRILTGLTERGFIERDFRRPRSIRITAQPVARDLSTDTLIAELARRGWVSYPTAKVIKGRLA